MPKGINWWGEGTRNSFTKRYKRTEARLAFLAKLNQAQTATQRIGLTLQKSRFQLKR